MAAIRYIAIVSALLLTSPLPSLAARSNLLLISIDTLRADRLGCYGYSRARTPVLDQLAQEGIQFEKTFSTVPLTLPAHTSILTGTYPSYHGVRDNSGFALPERETTLAEILKKAGYQTAAFVGAYVLDSKFGLDQGFDSYFDNFDLSRFDNVSPGYIQRTGDAVVRESLGWLQGNRESPFFLWVHLYDPHDPYTPPEPYSSRHPGRPYDGEIEFTDQNVGTLLDWMKDEGVYDNTLIIVVGDHGESLGEHGEDKHGFFIYNSTLHVPLIIRLPRGKAAGRRIVENVSIVDIFPTVLQLLETPRNLVPQVQGSGLTSLILGRQRTRREHLYAESYYPFQQFGWSPLRCLISGPFKFVLAPKPELYRIATDFDEKLELAEQNRALVNQFRRQLEEFDRRSSRSHSVQPARAKLDSETVEKLRSLGYVALSGSEREPDESQSLADPKDKIGLYRQVTDLFASSMAGRYDDVIVPYRKILESEPNLIIVRYKLGQAYFHTGDFNSALDEFKKVISMRGSESLATFDLAQTYLRLGRQKEAVVGFERTLALDPHHFRAKVNLGVLYKNQGKLREAVRQFKGALEVAHDSVFALSNLGVTYSMLGEHEKAVDALERAHTLVPKNAMVCANLGIAYRRLGKEEQALKYLKLAHQLNPKLGEN